jgi:hypothetical protein
MKKLLLSALFTLSLFFSTASAQDYKLFVGLIKPNHQYVGLENTAGFEGIST